MVSSALVITILSPKLLVFFRGGGNLNLISSFSTTPSFLILWAMVASRSTLPEVGTKALCSLGLSLESLWVRTGGWPGNTKCHRAKERGAQLFSLDIHAVQPPQLSSQKLPWIPREPQFPGHGLDRCPRDLTGSCLSCSWSLSQDAHSHQPHVCPNDNSDAWCGDEEACAVCVSPVQHPCSTPGTPVHALLPLASLPALLPGAHILLPLYLALSLPSLNFPFLLGVI